MAKGILSKRALDVLNRYGEIKSEIDFCDGSGLSKEKRHFMEWLGNHVRSEMGLEAWDEEIESLEDGVNLYLYSPKWQIRGHDDYVAFTFWWPNAVGIEPPCVQLYLPSEEVFAPRNHLLKQLRPALRRSGFTDYFEAGDSDPSVPLWKNIPLEEFHGESGFDLDSFVAEILDGFRQLLAIEPVIENAFCSLPNPAPPPPSERRLKTIAFLDTECEGSGTTRRMTQLAIVNAAYDTDEDAVVGILDEYCMNNGEALNETNARSVLERADFIVAHNVGADRPFLARHLPGTEKMKWRCSYREIEWKQLLDVTSESLETLMGKVGLRYEQDHNARADAHDLKRLLAVKHRGRTYLGRLLDSAATTVA